MCGKRELHLSYDTFLHIKASAFKKFNLARAENALFVFNLFLNEFRLHESFWQGVETKATGRFHSSTFYIAVWNT